MFHYFTHNLSKVVICLLLLMVVYAFVEQKFFGSSSATRTVRGPHVNQPIQPLPNAPLAAAPAHHREATMLLNDAELKLNLALDQIETWNDTIVPLRESAAGASIGGRDQLAEGIAYLFRSERPAATDLLATQNQIDDLQRQVQRLAAGPQPAPLPAAEMTKIRALHGEVTQAAHDWENAVTQAQAIVRESQRRPPAMEEISPAPPSSPQPPVPLGDVIDELNDHNILMELERERELQAKRAAEEAERREALAEEEARIAREKSELRKEASSAEVKRVLAPFLAKRFLQPKPSRAVVHFERTAREQPMSMSRLEAMGALSDSLEGLHALARIGTSRRLPQPRWSFGSQPRNWSPENQQLLSQAQSMLRRYGEILVEDELLAP